MAAGTSSYTTPSAADEVLRTTDEKANFQRLTRLLMCGGLALLTEVFDAIHPPANLPAVLGNPSIKKQLQTLRRNRVLTHPEWYSLYEPSGPGMYGKSADFDIQPTGWDNLPNCTDHSLEADLVRIKFYRNTVYGNTQSMEIKDADFEKLWMEISEALLRIAGSVSSAKRDEWKKSIKKFFHEPLTPDAKEGVDELRLWHLMDMDAKDKLEKLDEKMEQMAIKLEQMKIKKEDRCMEILIVLESLEASRSFVRSYPQEKSAQSPSKSVDTRKPLPPEHPIVKGLIEGLSTSKELLASQQKNPLVLNFWDVVNSFKRPLELLFQYLKTKIGVDVEDHTGSSVIKVSSSSLKGLKSLWKDYEKGHLNKVVQGTLVTIEVLEKLHLREVKLRAVISEEDYWSYKDFLQYSQSGKGKIFR